MYENLCDYVGKSSAVYFYANAGCVARKSMLVYGRTLFSLYTRWFYYGVEKMIECKIFVFR